MLLEKHENRDPEDGGSELENATPTDGILLFEERLKLLIERFAYSKRTWRKALEPSPGEPWDDWHNGYETATGDTMTDEFSSVTLKRASLNVFHPNKTESHELWFPCLSKTSRKTTANVQSVVKRMGNTSKMQRKERTQSDFNADIHLETNVSLDGF